MTSRAMANPIGTASVFAAGFFALSYAAMADGGVRDVAERFCLARLAADDVATRALLTPELLSEIEKAEARNAIIAKANPDEKPPFGDGIPFQSFPDAPAKCEAGAETPKGGKVRIEVRFSFPDQPNAAWTDRLVVVDPLTNPRIDDVLFASFATDSREYGLRRALFDAFDP